MPDEIEYAEVSKDITSQMIDNILAGDAVAAQEKFNSIVAFKQNAAFETRKHELAQSLYNGSETDQPESSETQEE